MRHGVHKDVKQHYDADNTYIIEAAMQFFGMDTRNSIPRNHAPPSLGTQEETVSWIRNTFGCFIDEMVFPEWSGHNAQHHVTQGI